MSYENYENTAFDMNRDGHIDASEASFIHDTYYGSGSGSGSSGYSGISFNGYGSSANRNRSNIKGSNRITTEMIRSGRRKKIIIWGILILLGCIFPKSIILMIAVVAFYFLSRCF